MRIQHLLLLLFTSLLFFSCEEDDKEIAPEDIEPGVLIIDFSINDVLKKVRQLYSSLNFCASRRGVL